MPPARRYRAAAMLFSLIALSALIALPWATRCCSRFSPEELALRGQWIAPGPVVADALLDWPLGYRLLLLTIGGAVLVALLLASASRLSSASMRKRRTAVLVFACQAVAVAVLCLWTIYALGYVGVGPSPLHVAWFVGLPLAIVLLGARARSDLLATLPLMLAGYVVLAIISLILGIPLD